MITTGIYLQHDQGAAVAVDGIVVAAAEEERFTRVKHNNPPAHAPYLATAWLAELGYRTTDVVAFADPTHSASAAGDELSAYSTLRGTQAPKRFEHHLCHAAAAHLWSGWDTCYILAIDGGGSDYYGAAGQGLKGAISFCAHDRMSNDVSVTNPGSWYLNMTQALGFKPLHDEGKVMCLAAGGDAQRFRSAFPYEIRPFHVEDRRQPGAARHEVWRPGLPADLSKSLGVDVLDERNRADIAATVQAIFEEMIWADVRAHVPEGSQLAVSGGCFANVVLNRKLLEWVDELFVVPPMNDGGLASGAALLACPKVHRLRDAYLGLDVGPALVDPRAVAKAIHDGACVGINVGCAELGPRALGNRSILADPRDPQVPARLGAKLRRDAFMPFAPVVLAEHADTILEGCWHRAAHAAEFMTVAFAVRSGWPERIPAVVHVDGTCRPQIIRREVNPWYWAVVDEFRKLTGIPCLLNTSANLHGLPINNTNDHAVAMFEAGGCDALVLGNEQRMRTHG